MHNGKIVVGGHMEASIQVTTAIVRTHEDGGKYGDPWTWTCTAQIVGDTAYLYAALRAPTNAEARALKKIMRSIGVLHLIWERKNSKLERDTKFEL